MFSTSLTCLPLIRLKNVLGLLMEYNESSIKCFNLFHGYLSRLFIGDPGNMLISRCGLPLLRILGNPLNCAIFESLAFIFHLSESVISPVSWSVFTIEPTALALKHKANERIHWILVLIRICDKQAHRRRPRIWMDKIKRAELTESTRLSIQGTVKWTPTSRMYKYSHCNKNTENWKIRSKTMS